MEPDSKGAGKGGKGKGRGDDAVRCATGCGKPGTKRCNGCKAVFYCGVECQRIHWKKNGHKVACKKTQARVAAAMASAAGGAPTPGGRGTAYGASVCIICLDAGDPQPIQSGCGCRGDAGLAHIGCRAEAAAHRDQSGDPDGYKFCDTCDQIFTAQMRMGLAEAWCGAVQDFDEEDEKRQLAGLNLAEVLALMGRYAECEAKCRELRAVQHRTSGPDAVLAMRTAQTLGSALSNQEKNAEAEVVLYGVLPKIRKQLGAEHPNTLNALMTLGNLFFRQGKFDDALATYQDTRKLQQKVLGAEHMGTMSTAMNIANTLCCQSKFQESAVLLRDLLGVQQRVLGAEHPATLYTGHTQCVVLYEQHKYGEAEARCREVLAAHRRVLGAEHPSTRGSVQLLALIQQRHA